MAVEHYDYRSPETHADADVPHGAGYYRHAHAPPVDPLEQSRSILQQAADAGAPFIACAEFVSELQWRAPHHRTPPPHPATAARHRCTRAPATMIMMHAPPMITTHAPRGCTRTCTCAHAELPC